MAIVCSCTTYSGFVLTLLLLVGEVLGECSDGQVRFDPNNAQVVQICLDGRWGYVCGQNNAWTTTDVGVFCQQLGYRSVIGDNIVHRENNSLSDQVNLQAVYCSGIENRLIDCPHMFNNLNTPNHEACKNGSTDMYYYALAHCSETANVTCRAGDIQVDEQNNGLLRICSEGQWWSLCGIGWTNESAQVACRQLELNPYGARAIGVTNTSPDNQEVNIRFYCTGAERMLSHCSPSQVGSECSSSTVAGIVCGVTPEPPVNVSIVAADLLLQISWSTVANAIGYTVNCTDDSVTSIVQESISINYTIIPYLLANTTYRCCVISLILNGLKSNPTCANITTPPLLLPKMSSSISPVSDSTQPQPTEMSSSRPSSSDSMSPAVSWIGGIFVGGTVVAIVLSAVLILICVLVWYRGKQKYESNNSNDYVPAAAKIQFPIEEIYDDAATVTAAVAAMGGAQGDTTDDGNPLYDDTVTVPVGPQRDIPNPLYNDNIITVSVDPDRDISNPLYDDTATAVPARDVSNPLYDDTVTVAKDVSNPLYDDTVTVARDVSNPLYDDTVTVPAVDPGTNPEKTDSTTTDQPFDDPQYGTALTDHHLYNAVKDVI